MGRLMDDIYLMGLNNEIILSNEWSNSLKSYGTYKILQLSVFGKGSSVDGQIRMKHVEVSITHFSFI